MMWKNIRHQHQAAFSRVLKKTPEVNQLRSLNFEGQKLESLVVPMIHDNHNLG